ncbi:hypothetical protein ABD91_21165 [Lysinibacillus sphaericus]|uniref:hypothetical protein n=1 Tax=Lysinibacillus sphaericus TaxID=1421 RepID=UPI0018CD02AE|nr:hypothetical protein [Lysinibacillus sphaericus]MBG9693250.1 hypothetical protein [Lysinibacillus sphaericus]
MLEFKPGIYRNEQRQFFNMIQVLSHVEYDEEQVLFEKANGEKALLKFESFVQHVKNDALVYLDNQERALELFKMNRSAAKFM